MALPISPNQSKFLSGLAQTTRYDPTVLAAWLRNEEPMTNQNTDPAGHGRFNFLNVGITDSKPYGAASSYWNTTPQAAGVATGNWLLGKLSIPGFGKSSAGIQGLAKYAGANPQQQIRAIQQSGWASGGETALPGLYQQFSGQKLEIPTAPVSAPPARALAGTPSAAAALPAAAAPTPDYGTLQLGLNSAAAAATRAQSALSAISGVERPAAPALDLSSLVAPTGAAAGLTVAPAGPTKTEHIVPLHGSTPPPKGLSPQATKAVALAKQFIGTPYLWGGANPKSGFDCSGLLQYVWAKNGVSIPHNAQAQYDTSQHVTLKQLRPGDAVFFRDETGIHHVGMAIGGGQFIQAPHTGDHVKISSLSDPYYASQFAGGGRFT